jgi:thioredoxin-dependent peroxiredoxin
MKNHVMLPLSLLVGVLILFSQFLAAKPKRNKLKIKPPQPAPAFNFRDVYGKTANLSDYQGKKILLIFYRNAGCPICNLRFHELQEQASYFKEKGLVVLAVYESDNATLKNYVGEDQFYATLIPDPSLKLYELYAIEKSMGKMMRGMFHGAMPKMKKGKKLFKTKIKQDGNGSRIGADFLIDENGTIAVAYYGQYAGDHLSIESIKKFIN